MRSLREFLKRRIEHAESRAKLTKADHGDNPGQTHTYFGGYDLGYWEGKASSYHMTLDMVNLGEKDITLFAITFEDEDHKQWDFEFLFTKFEEAKLYLLKQGFIEKKRLFERKDYNWSKYVKAYISPRKIYTTNEVIKDGNKEA